VQFHVRLLKLPDESTKFTHVPLLRQPIVEHGLIVYTKTKLTIFRQGSNAKIVLFQTITYIAVETGEILIATTADFAMRIHSAHAGIRTVYQTAKQILDRIV
jgi:hypothetical protein